MRFLLDESVDARLAATLRARAHEATVVGIDHPNSLPDEDVLAIARREGRVLITNDRDFGELVFKEGHLHSGVLYFRLSTTLFSQVERRLVEVLERHGDRIEDFMVITDRRIRRRR